MLLHLLTAAAIFVHATLGCCAHEAHAVSKTNNEPSTCGCHCEHHHSPQDDLSKESPEPVPHECSHTDCKWPAPETRTDTDLLTRDFAGFVPSTATISLASVLGNELDFSALSPHNALHPLPVRAHLAHCVFLI